MKTALKPISETVIYSFWKKVVSMLINTTVYYHMIRFSSDSRLCIYHELFASTLIHFQNGHIILYRGCGCTCDSAFDLCPYIILYNLIVNTSKNATKLQFAEYSGLIAGNGGRLRYEDTGTVHILCVCPHSRFGIIDDEIINVWGQRSKALSVFQYVPHTCTPKKPQPSRRVHVRSFALKINISAFEFVHRKHNNFLLNF